MPDSIKSSCSKLGFNDQSPDRQQKILKRAISEFRSRRGKEGHQLHTLKRGSKQVLKLAQEFCSGNEKGAKFWPEHFQGTDPSKKGKTIVKHVARIIESQSINQVTSDKRRLKKNVGSLRESSPTFLQVDLVNGENPERLPIQQDTMLPTTSAPDLNLGPNTIPIMTDVMNNTSHLEEICRKEIQSLDPRRDSEPLTAFTVPWISESNGLWPTEAIIRLKTWMYEQDSFDSEAPKMNARSIVEKLLHRTDLQQANQELKNAFLRRTHDRMGIVTQNGCASGLLERDDTGKVQKGLIFRSFWRNRYSQWGPNTSPLKNAQSQRHRDIYETPLDEQDAPSESRECESASTAYQGEQEQATAEFCRRTEESGNFDFNPHGAKRPKHSQRTPSAKKPIVTPVRAHRADAIESMEPEVIIISDDVEDVQSSISRDNRPNSGSPTFENRETSSDNSQTRYSTVGDPRGSMPLEDQAPISPPLTKSSLSPAPWFPHGTPIHQPAQLVFKPRKYLDEDTGLKRFITGREFADLSLAQFISLYSQRFNVPHKSLEQLTFRPLFDQCKTHVVQMGDEQKWRNFKDITIDLFFTVKEEEPDKDSFTVLVIDGESHDSKRKRSQMFDF